MSGIKETPVASLAIVLAVALLMSTAAPGQRLETTGSRLGNTIHDRIVTRFGTPHEVSDVLDLLEDGKTGQALELAEAYLESLDSTAHTGFSDPLQERYLALNAYCVALNESGRPRDAIEACSEAIALIPNRWTALSNRGTAWQGVGYYDLAIADYLEALRHSPNERATGLINANLAIARERLAATR